MGHLEDYHEIGRRAVLAGMGSLALDLPRAARAEGGAAEYDIVTGWQNFKGRFVSSEGRVIDTGNRDVSHSEGQGWGLLFAEAAGDKDGFDLILAWTSTHLARPNDALHIWKYDPNAADPTADTNNATDGDIFIAWALARGAQRWQQSELHAAAAAIAGDILNKLCIERSGQVFLLPGIMGFATGQNLTLNPSYYIFPALDTLAMLSPSEIWSRLRVDGLDLLQNALFGRWGLPPDWLSVSCPGLRMGPASAWPPRFSFDAIRVPLWLSWAGTLPEGMARNFRIYWQSRVFPYRPAWVNLENGSYANFPAPSGMEAIADLTLAVEGNTQLALPAMAAASNYYSAALTLLARMAAAHLNLIGT